MSYKEECPVCGKNNFAVTPENGFSYCFTPGCGYREQDGEHKQQKKVRSQNIDQIRVYYKMVAYYYHSSIDERARDFLHRRGYTDKLIQEKQIGYCPPGKHPIYKSEIAKDAGLSTFDDQAVLADRIIFPYFAKNKVVDIRGRAIEKTEELKYKSPYKGSFYRGADYPYNYDQCANAETVILTEGEIKADISYRLNIPTLALPGMGIWKEGWKPRGDQKVVILFDSQRDNVVATRCAIKSAADKICEPYVATLPLMGRNKMDIDSFILEYGSDVFRMIINAALPYHEWTQYQRF